ncbi:MAG: DEAD/DEAH box helicase [Elainellaceae cyanobacterium]
MIPSVVATQVRNCVSDYLRTTFRPTTPGFEHLVDRFLDTPDHICKGPYLSIGLPFRSSVSDTDFFQHIPLGFAPYRHQEKAFLRLSPPYYQSTLIATGTGSGKTECFLMPILEHCRQHCDEPGIKAILIYPMNALATDQAKRFAELIHNTPSLSGKVRAGLYVGDSDATPTTHMSAEKVITDKQVMREAPPDLLLTNYKMLDYLLIQPDTQRLWQQNESHTLRYMVVDEFHTFDGAQGTDLACLIRRLKHRLQVPPQHLACVGTSATLGGESNRQDMLDYAQTIFQEPFDADALIEEDRITASEFLQDTFINMLPLPGPDVIAQLRPDFYASPDAYIRAQADLWLQDQVSLNDSGGLSLGMAAEQKTLPLSGGNPEQLALADLDPNRPLNDPWKISLGEELKALPIVQNLIRSLEQSPKNYNELLDKFQRLLHLPTDAPPDYDLLLLDSLLSLISVARQLGQKSDGQEVILPWLSLRVQIWFRELKRMVGSVEREPHLLYSDDLTTKQKEKTLPIVHCRDCGATGWAGVRPSQNASKLIANDLQRFYRDYFSRKPLVTFIFPCHESQPDSRLFCSHCFSFNSPRSSHCSSCNSDELIRVHIPNTSYTESRNGQAVLFSSSNCPYCSSSNGLSIIGAQAASLTSAMIGVLYTTPFNRDKKLLTFSDSVQDAAHRAGFYGARTYRTTLRTAIAHTIATHPEGLSLESLTEKFPKFWRNRLGSVGNYVATFLTTDLEWLREWDDFLHSDHPDLPNDSSLITIVNNRLTWEIVNQFGHRSGVGPSLERSGVCAASFDPEPLEKAIAAIHLWLTNEIEELRQTSLDNVRQFVLGILHHLRQRGGILQPVTASYISAAGNTFLLQRPLYMPNLGPRIPAPTFLVNVSAGDTRFERAWQTGNRLSWCEDWARRVFAGESLLLKEQVVTILQTVLDTLVEDAVLEIRNCGSGRAWGIPMAQIHLKSGGEVLSCDRCNHQLTASPREHATLKEMTCLAAGCTGHYRPDPRTGLAYYRQIYQNGEVRRIMAAEHTGLLARTNREWLEQRFIDGDRRCDPNLISATSTLEMGINIGDLSTVLLCSIPPAAANFQQRIGRAGRRDGNALVGAIANGKPHDLYFYSDPIRMLAGNIEAAGCYLDASAILQRQLTAFCLDNWVVHDITRREFPTQLNEVLNALQKQDKSRFPLNWLTFIQEHQSELLDSFLQLFAADIDQQDDQHRTQEQLRIFMEKGEQDEGGLRWRILNRLEGVREERARLSNQIRNLTKKIQKFKEQPEALQKQEQERLDELNREKLGFRGLMRSLNDKHILNFLTDEGLLPNYSFPEAGVTLQSILWRRKTQADGGNGKRYETFTLSYERPGALAIRELVPSGVFYAEGRRVKIDQIDLRLSSPEDWRICRSCNYAVQNFKPEAHEKTCPRCGDSMWSDHGRIRRMLRLRQVMATTADKDSRFGDDSEDRNTAFFQRHLLVDFEPEFREKTYLVSDKEFPFGFEYISRTSFRELNMGEPLGSGETVELAGRKFSTQGFQICRSCGKVMRPGRAKEKNHTIGCQFRDKPDQAKALDVLYLYREFESEAIRLLLPSENFWADQGQHSFIAALQLGLKRKFGGKVDHLHTTIGEDPQPNSSVRKPFLYLFDSVPGGTGYLRQLIRDPRELRDVFEQALSVLRVCECQTDPDKDGCYSCLFAYRNSFDQDKTSRKTAINLLTSVIRRWDELEETSQGLSAIRLNSNFESELERRFIEAVRRYGGTLDSTSSVILRKEIINGRAGYYLKLDDTAWTIETQVSLGNNEGVMIPSRADFLIRPASSRTISQPIAIFTDGWEYHQERLTHDLQQRLSILRSNQFWCWSLTWDDVAFQLDPDYPFHRADGMQPHPQSPFSRNQTQTYQQYKCAEMRSLEAADSFKWLMAYLANPDVEQWRNWGLLRTLTQAAPQSITNSEMRDRCIDELTTSCGQDAISLWNLPQKFLASEVEVSSLLRLWGLLDPIRHSELDSLSSIVLMKLDDLPQGDKAALRQSWIEALRLLNLYQFLPHTYAVTASGANEGIMPPTAVPTETPVENTNSYESTQWEQIRQLILEKTLQQAIGRMRQEQWPLPEAGYELAGDDGAIIAMAELAWPEAKVAVTLTDVDHRAFAQAEWCIVTVDAFLESMDSIREKLGG